jgi:hypothetical protein
MSTAAPGANGTMMRAGRGEVPCARVPTERRAAAIAVATRNPVKMYRRDRARSSGAAVPGGRRPASIRTNFMHPTLR